MCPRPSFVFWIGYLNRTFNSFNTIAPLFQLDEETTQSLNRGKSCLTLDHLVKQARTIRTYHISHFRFQLNIQSYGGIFPRRCNDSIHTLGISYLDRFTRQLGWPLRTVHGRFAVEFYWAYLLSNYSHSIPCIRRKLNKWMTFQMALIVFAVLQFTLLFAFSIVLFFSVSPKWWFDDKTIKYSFPELYTTKLLCILCSCYEYSPNLMNRCHWIHLKIENIYSFVFPHYHVEWTFFLSVATELEGVLLFCSSKIQGFNFDFIGIPSKAIWLRTCQKYSSDRIGIWMQIRTPKTRRWSYE